MVAGRIIALLIFLGMFILIILGKIDKHKITLGAAALVLVVVFGICLHSWTDIWNALALKSMFKTSFWYGEAKEDSFGINWATILFIFGVSVMVDGLSRAGFFKWLTLSLAKAVKYKVIPLFIIFMLISGILSMFIGSITVIMFLAAVTIELSRTLKFDPIPMILAEIFCSNLGGAATMAGDPPNIIIGTSIGATFFDFMTNTGLIVGISFIIIMIFFLLMFRKDFKKSEKARPENVVFPSPAEAITNKAAFIVGALIFVLTVVLLMTHAKTGLTVTTIGIIAALLTVIGTAATSGIKQGLSLVKHVDYKTLGFFIGLFIVVSGLEGTGCLDYVAKFITTVSGGNPYIVVAIILWVAAIFSAFVDNIPFAATMVPVIESMAVTTGIPLTTLAWTLSLGTDIGGNATPIGASANVVGISISSRNGYTINWGKYCKYNAPATIIVILTCMLCVYVKYL